MGEKKSHKKVKKKVGVKIKNIRGIKLKKKKYRGTYLIRVKTSYGQRHIATNNKNCSKIISKKLEKKWGLKKKGVKKISSKS